MSEKTPNNDQQAFIENVRDNLDNSVESLDETTRNKLAVARREALAQAGEKHHRSHWWFAAPGAAAALFAVALIWPQPEIDAPPMALLENLDLLILQEEMELFEAAYQKQSNDVENETIPPLEFYGES